MTCHSQLIEVQPAEEGVGVVLIPLLGWPVMGGPIHLRVAVSADGSCVFSYAGEKAIFTELPSVFVARAGGWMGAKVGLFASGEAGYAEFDSFKVSGLTA